MRIETKLVAAALGAATLWASPAAAQATRTWVSGVGDDVNPCSRTAPCKTFAGAISKTAAGGEINCLDPAGYGAVTITKSMTIDCHYTEGGALAGGNGIVINALSTDVVVLRGLDIFGVNPPSNGVRFIAGGALHIEDCVIRRFNAANSVGVSFAPASGTAKLFITNTTITSNGNGATGGGIEIKPTGSGIVKAMIVNSNVLNNANNGLRVDTTSSTGSGTSVVVEGSQFAGNNNGISTNSTTSVLVVAVNGSTLIHNANAGISNNGGNSSMTVGNTTITGNGIGVSATAGAATFTYGDNRNDANPDFVAPNNGSFVLPALPKK